MTQRLNPFVKSLAQIQPLIDFATGIQAKLDKTLVELVKIRASQINGCAVCIHMHTREARQAGETEERIYLLDAWRESPLYSARERAALAFTEALTKLDGKAVPDDVYALVAAEFSEEERVTLTLVIVAINGFNRINCAFAVQHPATTAVRKAA